MRQRPLNETKIGSSDKASSSLRRLSRASLIQGTTGSGRQRREVLGRRLSSLGDAFVDGCGTGPDAGPKLDMPPILASVAAGRQAGKGMKCSCADGVF